jgi:pyruvate/2-oxoacid:ferredoxin oxidoreductase alpha subunit
MGFAQDYTDFKIAERERENEAWKKADEEEKELLEKRAMQEIDMLAGLQDAQREEFEITEAIAEYRAEDAFNAAMNYGNAAQALQLLNDGL